MKFKEIFITTLLCILVLCLFILNYVGNRYVLNAQNIYKVYLDGEVIGYIEDQDKLYNLINKNQKDVMKKYHVKNVYPSSDFKIVKTKSYNVDVSSEEDIYNLIAKKESFTVKGYIVTIKGEEDKKVTINILNRNTFENALHTFINAFLTEEEYNNYINDTQDEIEDTGKIIEKMYFDETITIKEGLIDISEDIYTDEKELSQYLLFGKDYKINYYTVNEGDTIESVSERNKLNSQEFLVANPEYTSKDSLLKIGDKVNITLINPVITLSYEVNEVSDSEIPYEDKIEYDTSKPYGYSEVTTQGVTGVTRITSKYAVKNGEMQSGVVIVDQKNLVQKVDQVTVRGGGTYYGNQGSGSYVDTGDVWGWPTNSPYMITSGFEWRWGTFHEGIDISGTGYGSPIYAALDGEVVNSGYGGMVGGLAGYNVVIKHSNGYYTVYAHLVENSNLVAVGDHVKRGQRIGSMGNSGYTTGYHLHFALYKGVPYGGGQPINPLTLWGRR